MSINQESPYDKLREGQRILASASSDPYRLSAALLKLHGALEDRLRELLAHQLPERGGELFDKNRVGWKEVLDLAERHLSLSRADRELIHEANRYRDPLAQGGDFTWNRRGLVQFEALARAIWANGSRSGPVLPPFPPELVPPVVQPPAPPSQQKTRPARAPLSANLSWKRSKWLYWALFLFLNPLWVALVMLDRAQKWPARSLAFGLAAGYLALALYLWTIHQPLPAQAVEPEPTETPAPAPTRSPTRAPSMPATPTQAPSLTAETASGGCQVAWVPYAGPSIANKNRAAVWEEYLKQQIPPAALSYKNFIQQVVDQNPGLAEDGYVFKKGKTYLLPACQ